MTPNEFILRLYECDKHTKIVLNNGGFEEIEMKLFMLKDAITVERLFVGFVKHQWLYVMDGRVVMKGGPVKDIIYHHDHYKENRFYEIVTENEDTKK